MAEVDSSIRPGKKLTLTLALWFTVISASRILEKSWWGPGSLAAIVCGGSAIATSILAPEYYMSLNANLALAALSLCILLGSLISKAVPERQERGSLPSLIIGSTRGFFWFGMISSIVGFYAIASTVGLDYASLIRPSQLFSAVQGFTKDRYTEGIGLPLYGNLASACVMTYFVLLVMHTAAGGKFRPVFALPVLLFLLSNLLVTTRSTLVYLTFLGILAYGYAHQASSRTGQFPKLFRRRFLLLCLGGALGLVAIFVTFQMLRFGDSDGRSIGDVMTYLRRWPWGSVPGFSLWWEGHAPAEVPHSPGYYTFMGVYDNLGIEARTQGAYQGFVFLTPEEPGNIYTAFRGLIDDFGQGGASIFCVLLGILAGLAYRRTLPPSLRMTVFFAAYMWIATSFIVSYWAFVGNLFAALALPVLWKSFRFESQEERVP